ncbi:MAG TPA: PPOX class F420-dependent oxidoreductase [Dehalococcoidia bacterium]|nr:PPOX class F420-dependent oxidoreductase [Dehalococcoidia bacterium]
MSSNPPVRRTDTPTSFAPAVEEFLARPIPAPLAMINPSGSPQQTIMWYRYENGYFLFTTTTTRVKFRNYQRDPRGSLAVLDPENMYRWVIVNGSFSIDDRDPVQFYKDLAEHYLRGEALASWKHNTTFENRTVLRLTPTRIRTMGFPTG